MVIIKKLRFFKKSTIEITFIQVKYTHLRRLEISLLIPVTDLLAFKTCQLSKDSY